MKLIDKLTHEFAEEISQMTFDGEMMASQAYRAGFYKALELVQKEMDLFKPDIQKIINKEVEE